MLNRIALPALSLSLLLLAGQARAQDVHSQTVTYSLDADNDLALYVGNADGSIFRQVVDKTTNWNTAATGSFTLNPGEEYFYMVSLNYGGPGDIGGFLNDVSLVDMGNWESKDVSGLITGFPSTEDTTFNPDVDEIQSLIAAGNFTPAAPSISFGTSAPILGTQTFVTPTGETATVYRQSVTSANVTPESAAAPEPSSFGLAFATGLPIIGMVRRRSRRTAQV